MFSSVLEHFFKAQPERPDVQPGCHWQILNSQSPFKRPFEVAHSWGGKKSTVLSPPSQPENKTKPG